MSLMVRIKHVMMYPIHILKLKRDAYRCWYLYNKSILDFKETYPEDMIIVELNHFTRNYNPIVEVINNQFKTELLNIKVEEVVDDSLLTKNSQMALKTRFFSVTKLEQLLYQLKKKAIWI
jgi:hypothetical protein